MKTSRSNQGKIDYASGCGGFLNPPTHPEHTHSVCSRYGDHFFMSLTGAAETEWLDVETRNAARNILKEWTAPALESGEVQEWVRRVLGYFAGCYVGQDAKGKPSWNASDLRIDPKADPLLNADIHAGVHLIREYYPGFAPTAQHFALAYWGTKKGAA